MKEPFYINIEKFGLIYSEVQENLRPEIRASFPKFPEDIERTVELRTLPHKRQNELSDLFRVYQLNSDLIAVSYLRNLKSARTLSGSKVACLTMITDIAINPFKLKPFLESITLVLLKIIVDEKLIKKIVTEITKKDGQLKIKTKSQGIPAHFSFGIPEESNLPHYFSDLSKNLSKI